MKLLHPGPGSLASLLLVTCGGEVVPPCDRLGQLCSDDAVVLRLDLTHAKGATADLDGDGVLDLLSAGPDVGLAIAWGYAGQRDYQLFPGGATDVKTGDIDGDGDSDVLFTTVEPGALRVLVNNGTRQPADGPTLVLAGRPQALWLGQLDADASLDAVVASGDDGTLTVITDGLMRAQPVTVGQDLAAVEVGDVDSDGRLDLVAVDRGDAGLYVVRATGSGFAAPQRITTGIAGATNTATESPPVVECPVAFTNTVSDIDGDGHNDAYISNQEQLAELAGCTDMSGSLYLNSGVTDLTPLVSLRHIAGKLDIGGSSYTTEPKGLLSLAGLEALESVGGLAIKNVSMTDLEPLGGLTSIPGDVQITGLLRLDSLEGLHNLEHIGGELNIGDGKQLLDLNGLRNLQQVGTHIFISQLEITSLHGLEALTEVGVPGGEPSTIRLYGLHQLTSLDALAIDWHDAHALWIYQSAISDLGILAGVDDLNSLELLDNKMLMDLAGLESLVVVHDVLALDGNDNLIDIDALASLQSVGALTLNDSPLTDLGPLPALQQVGDVRVAQNEQLIALSALAGFTSVGSLVLEDNPALAVVPDLAALTQIDGNLEIRRNDALISITDLSAVTKVGGRLVVVVNPELPETDAETWAAPINVGGDRKIAGNKQDPAPPASPCPWVEDGECDEDANGLGICAPNTDEQDCIFG